MQKSRRGPQALPEAVLKLVEESDSVGPGGLGPHPEPGGRVACVSTWTEWNKSPARVLYDLFQPSTRQMFTPRKIWNSRDEIQGLRPLHFFHSSPSPPHFFFFKLFSQLSLAQTIDLEVLGRCLARSQRQRWLHKIWLSVFSDLMAETSG